MDCPQCGGDTYDNRQKVQGGWKGPLYKCKDAECGWVKWAPKGAKQNGNGKNAAPKRPLGQLYFNCMKMAAATVREHLGEDVLPADVIAATATLFIQAATTGAPLAAPPKPKPEPEPEDDGEGYDDEHGSYEYGS